MPPTQPPTGSETTLSGDWGGSRKRLYDAGVQADLVYSADYLRDTTGGLKRGGAYMGHFDLILQFDGEKLVGWRGGSAYLQLISNSGGRVNLNHVGSLMGRRQPRSAGQSHRHLQGLAATILPGRQGLAAGRPLPDRQRVLHHRFIGRLPASVIRDGCRSRQLRQPGRAVDLSDEFLCGAPAYRPPILRGTRWSRSRVEFRASGSRPPAPMSVGRRAQAAC
jgi:hypothetical protein